MGSAPSILVIDHSMADVVALKRAFGSAGVANPLYSVRSRREAMEYLSGQPPYLDRMQYPLPSVILLAMEQPRSSELLTWIRDKFPSGGLLIVALTPVAQIRRLPRAYALG